MWIHRNSYETVVVNYDWNFTENDLQKLQDEIIKYLKDKDQTLPTITFDDVKNITDDYKDMLDEAFLIDRVFVFGTPKYPYERSMPLYNFIYDYIDSRLWDYCSGEENIDTDSVETWVTEM